MTQRASKWPEPTQVLKPLPLRDMTKAEFDRKCRQYGFTPLGFDGYYSVDGSLHVSIHNRSTWRARLA